MLLSYGHSLAFGFSSFASVHACGCVSFACTRHIACGHAILADVVVAQREGNDWLVCFTLRLPRTRTMTRYRKILGEKVMLYPCNALETSSHGVNKSMKRKAAQEMGASAMDLMWNELHTRNHCVQVSRDSML